MCADFAMTSSGDLWACDTSAAVAAVDPTHEALADLGIVGGSVYDALAGHAASTNRRIRLTRGRRAGRTCRSLDAQYRFVD